MIKIEKDISAIPDSLKLPFDEYFPHRIPSPSQTTHDRRIEVIDKKEYINEKKYNERYKQDDVKTALKNIYHKKCAFCEQQVELRHVEHYRPKDTYYWLAFSWDNLLLACPLCNTNKGTNFDLLGTAIEFEKTDSSIENIHNSSKDYDRIEVPKMVNPEVTDPLGKIRFHKNGAIESDFENFAYTIEKCKIDRAELNDQRRAFLNEFRKDITSVLVENSNINDQKVGIATIVSKFIRDSKNIESTFLAFKRYAISSRWLDEIVKELN